MRRYASKDAGRKKGWCGSPHRLEKGTNATRMLGGEGVDCEIPHWLGRRMKRFFIRVWNGKLSEDARP